ncbi:S-adenosyl-L-methionine-dependent methyltransferases superfamily protein [Euphorbia peplus]|nr:S-adenosyl-L-methionine-dependent methyltransferases superfamily protein [Euphorbia peplus]
MAISVPNLIKEKKFPYIFTFFVLFVCATIVLYANDSPFPSFSIADLQKQSDTSFAPPIEHSVETLDSPSGPPHDSDGTDASKGEGIGSYIGVWKGKERKGSAPVINFGGITDMKWEMCKGPLATDLIPCLDNVKAIKALQSRRHMEHRERHCPKSSLKCLVPIPKGYKMPIPWPKSRDMIWYDNVPHDKLVDYKKDQNWVKKDGDLLLFPGGGTQFKDGVSNYIDFIEKASPLIHWGRRTRVVLDVGCGVASFGGYLLDKQVITMSFAPKDEHEAQIQFALERGIPATLSVIGTKKLTYPDNAFDLIHCARCRVHWDADGGKPLFELNRILRPGGLFVWSATPVYRKDDRDKNVWQSMTTITQSMCWKEVSKMTDSTGIGLVIYQKPDSSTCYEQRERQDPPMCDQNVTKHTSWYVPLSGCLSRLPVDSNGSLVSWPVPWPMRLNQPPSLSSNPDALDMFLMDSKHWSVLVSDVYLNAKFLNWSSVRNVMDMNAGKGGFGAALVDLPFWVMNVVPFDAKDTLPIIFERGLIGVYHDWCESFNTYPRTYDLLHSSFLFKRLVQRCELVDVAVEIDRIVRPGGYVVIQDTMEMMHKLAALLRSLHWKTLLHQGQYLFARKSFWRPG